MNWVQIHLIVNHAPVVGVPIALFLLVASRILKNDGVAVAARLVTMIAAVFALFAFFSGEPAEELVENIPCIAESLIHPHEEAAELATVISVISGLLAALGCFLSMKKPESRLNRMFPVVLFVVLSANAGALGYAAHLGGKIRHPELSNDFSGCGCGGAGDACRSDSGNQHNSEHEEHED
jgi:hypothetical protein